ncbi:MAG: tyrosine-type recombinase/integrase [Candidatus Acidiferrales bacterium]
MATAAFSGLRKSELRGLRWGDLRDGQLYVERSFWKSSLEEKPKSTASRAGVPVIDQLAKILEAHRNGFAAADFIFAGPKLGRPLDLKNLANRIIIPALEKKKIEWHGWHAFRRGLGTNLDHLGVKDQLIQLILRHADVATTKKHYIKPPSPDVRGAMGKLSKVLEAMAKKK